MNEQRIETSESPHIMIPSCSGQVVVKSWRETAVSIQGASFNAEQNGNAIKISSEDDLFLAVPAQTSVSLGVVKGDVTLKHLESGITGDDLEGNVTLNNVNAVQIDKVGVALAAEDLNSTLEVGHVEGAVSLKRVSRVRIGDVNGSVTIEHARESVELGQVEGDLMLKSIRGNVMVANAFLNVTLENIGGNIALPSVIGDIWLVGGLRPGEQTFFSEKTIYIYWPQNEPVNLYANAPQIDNFLSLSDVEERREDGQVILTGHIEEGKTELAIKAEYRIAMKPLGNQPPRFSPDEFMVPATVESELAQKVRTAVHAVLIESPEVMGTGITGLEDRLVTAVLAEVVEWEQISPLNTEKTDEAVDAAGGSPENLTHILQLVRDGSISIEQAVLLLEALEM